MDYDAELLIGRTVVVTIVKSKYRKIFRECIVKKFIRDQGIWIARCIYKRNQVVFDLADIIEGRVDILPK